MLCLWWMAEVTFNLPSPIIPNMLMTIKSCCELSSLGAQNIAISKHETLIMADFPLNI